MNILAISGSLRAASTNTSLLRAIANVAPSEITVNLYDGLDDLPHFSPERDTGLAPAAVQSLRTQLREADAVIICTPEYIHGMPGVLKNMLDWIASSGEFVHKPTGIISAGPSDTGGMRAHAALSHTLEVLMAETPEKASLIVSFVKQRLGANDQLIDPVLAQELQDVISSLAELIERQKQAV